MKEELVLDIIINDNAEKQSLQQMKAEVRELQGLLTTLEPNTEAFQAAAEKAGKLKDEIQDAQQAVNEMSGEPVENLKNGFEGLGSKLKSLDFEGVTRSLNTMGTSFGKLNIGNIVKQIGQMGLAFVKLAGQILLSMGPLIAVAGAIAAVAYAFKLQADAEKEAEEATKKFNETMSDSSEIMMAHKTAIEGLSDEFKKASMDAQLASGEITKEQYDMLVVQEESMKKFTDASSRNYDAMATIEQNYNNAVAAEKKRYASIFRVGTDGIEEDRAEHNQKLLDLQKKYESDSLKEQTEFNKEKSLIEDTYSKRITAIIVNNNKKEAEENAKKWASMNESADNYFKELEKKYYGSYYTAIVTYDEELAKYKQFLANKTWTLEQYNEAVTMLQNTQAKKLAELDKIEEHEELDATMTLTDEAYDYWLDAQIKKKEEEERLRIEREGAENEFEALRTGQYAKDIMGFEWSNKKKLEVLKNYYNDGKIQEEHYNDAVQQVWQDRLSNWSSINNAMGSMTQDLFSFIGNITDKDSAKQKKIKKAAFTVDKINNATETGIATAKAVMEAAPNIPLQILVGLQGAAAVAAILSKKYVDSDAGGSGGNNSDLTSTSSSVAMPNVTNLYTAGGGTPTTFQSLSQENQGMNYTQVYVLESDITSTQANVAKVNVQSTF